MKVLELFSGTHSVGKVARARGWEVLSLDIDGDADINIDILKWDYKKDYKEGDFDIVWASPPCNTFSQMRNIHIGRRLKCFGDEIVTREMLYDDMVKNGVPLLRKTQEIIDYFKPKFWFIENPKLSKIKNFLNDVPYYNIDYCQYSDWGYKKPTRIWTNKKNFSPRTCNKECKYIVNGKHIVDMAQKHSGGGNKKTLALKYRIPPNLINDLFSGI